MARFPAIGKISPEFFDRYVFPRLGVRRPEVLVLPRHGVDVGVVQIGPDWVMAVTTDPIYIVPQYGWERAAWFAWHILASDVTTSGFPPAYAVFDFNLPVGMTEEAFERVWAVIDGQNRKYGVTVIAGHTGWYPGVDYPMVGGATFIAVGPRDRYLTAEMARPGDLVVVTKGAAIEAVGILSNTFPHYVHTHLGEAVSRKAAALFERMSTVEDALTSVSIGVREEGVTAMHDATECGVLGGVWEVAEASGQGIVLYKDEIPVLEEVRAVCDLFGIDPYTAISEGTLIVTVRPSRADDLLKALGSRGILARVVGEVRPPEQGKILIERGQARPLEHPRVDPFWGAMQRALEQGLT
ncbi:MAG: AIR synthase family protein [Acidobacteria bacterium]|nr:AIR synthase family protein [Acidobacteriota bacterium]MDW7985062.1 AIR synthase family protein [Acidobacteriota bacterium]